LVNFISDNAQIFSDIGKNIISSDLKKVLKYSRPKDKEDRELDAYKIYINSLYVAFTRAIKNLYIVEEKSHRILEILEVVESEKIEVEAEESLKDDWIKEANRLKELGKVEQAKIIEKKELSTLEFYSKNIDDLKNIDNNKKIKIFKLAKKEGDINFIMKLANNGFRSAKRYLNKINNEMKKDFISAIEKNDIERVQKHINDGIYINIQDNDGRTALIVASQQGYKGIVKLLIKNGADINIQGFDGKSNLIIALENKNEDMAKLLIKNGIDVNIQDNNKFTALMIASNNANKDIVQLLIEKRANINLQDIDGSTALMDASQTFDIETVELLIKSGADVNIQTNEGKTALMVASLTGYKPIVKLLITNGANIHLKTTDGATAFTFSTYLKNYDIQYLLDDNINDNRLIESAKKESSSESKRKHIEKLLKTVKENSGK